MKRSLGLLSLLLFLTSCASGGAGSGETSDPEGWPVGDFRLEGSVSYDRNGFVPRGHMTEQHWFEVSVRPGPLLYVTSSAGYCRWPTGGTHVSSEGRLSPDYHGPVYLYCGETTLNMRPFGSSLRGEMSVPYVQQVRRRGACVRYDPAGNCVQYDMITESRSRRASANLRITLSSADTSRVREEP